MEFNKLIEKYFDANDDSGFTQMIFDRQAKKKALKERVKKYLLTEAEIEELFKIIEKAEMDIEKIKRSFKKKNYTEDDLVAFQDKIVLIQRKMKDDFEKKLLATIKRKYETAKKILEEMDRKKGL